MDRKVIFPFNNNIETGLRTLCILNSLFPKSYDLETLVCLDYYCVHTGDFDSNLESLHPDIPQRSGEIFVRRSIIEEALQLFIVKGLVTILYLDSGIEYQASELSASFLDKVGAPYTIALIQRSILIGEKLKDLDNSSIQALVKHETTDYAFQKMIR